MHKDAVPAVPNSPSPPHLVHRPPQWACIRSPHACHIPPVCVITVRTRITSPTRSFCPSPPPLLRLLLLTGLHQFLTRITYYFECRLPSPKPTSSFPEAMRQPGSVNRWVKAISNPGLAVTAYILLSRSRIHGIVVRVGQWIHPVDTRGLGRMQVRTCLCTFVLVILASSVTGRARPHETITPLFWRWCVSPASCRSLWRVRMNPAAESRRSSARWWVVAAANPGYKLNREIEMLRRQWTTSQRSPSKLYPAPAPTSYVRSTKETVLSGCRRVVKLGKELGLL